MKPSTKDQVKGTFRQAKGAIKEIAGDLTDNPKLEAEGVAEKIDGKAQKKIGQMKRIWEK